MKGIILGFFVLVASVNVNAQLNPVAWSFSAKKVADKTYEVQMVATMQIGWHLYSQV